MRPIHKSSGRFEKSFESDVVLKNAFCTLLLVNGLPYLFKNSVGKAPFGLTVPRTMNE